MLESLPCIMSFIFFVIAWYWENNSKNIHEYNHYFHILLASILCQAWLWLWTCLLYELVALVSSVTCFTTLVTWTTLVMFLRPSEQAMGFQVNQCQQQRECCVRQRLDQCQPCHRHIWKELLTLLRATKKSSTNCIHNQSRIEYKDEGFLWPGQNKPS